MSRDEKAKRSVLMLQAFLSGRIKQLQNCMKQAPADSEAYQMAIAELQSIYDRVLPEMLKAVK